MNAFVRAVQAQPLYCATWLAGYMRDYWVFLGTALLLTTMPDLLGRCDLYPPQTIWERFRWEVVECVFAVLLLTKALIASDPLGLVTPLGWWALVAYVSHVMLSRVSPTPSDAAIIEFALAPLFVLGFHLAAYRKRTYGGADAAPLFASFWGGGWAAGGDAARKDVA